MLKARKPKKDKAEEIEENFILGAQKYPKESQPWNDPALREDVKKTMLLYLNEIDKVKLQHVAKLTGRSMHQVCIEAVRKEFAKCLK